MSQLLSGLSTIAAEAVFSGKNPWYTWPVSNCRQTLLMVSQICLKKVKEVEKAKGKVNIGLLSDLQKHKWETLYDVPQETCVGNDSVICQYVVWKYFNNESDLEYEADNYRWNT